MVKGSIYFLLPQILIMSRQFIESFFPSTSLLVKRYLPNSILQATFPDDLDERCPEVTVQVPAFSSLMDDGSPLLPIRNPVLGIWILVGMAIGSLGGWYWWQRRRRQPPLFQHGYDSFSSCGWPSIAFTAFGGMNAVALPLHCWFPRHDVSSAQYPLWWMMDCVLTGISSLSLCQGALELLCFVAVSSSSKCPSWMTRLLDQPTRQRFPAPFWTVGCTLLVLAVLSSYCVDISVVRLLLGITDDEKNALAIANIRGTIWKEPLWVEWTYLGPLLLAACLCPLAVASTTVMLLLGDSNRCRSVGGGGGKRWMHWWGPIAIMILGLLLGALGVMAVDVFCRWSGQDFADALSAPSLVFAGCDLAFLGLHGWLRQVANQIEEDETTRGSKAKQS